MGKEGNVETKVEVGRERRKEREKRRKGKKGKQGREKKVNKRIGKCVVSLRSKPCFM